MLFRGYQAPATGCDGDLRLVGSIVHEKRIAKECARLMWENISGGHFHLRANPTGIYSTRYLIDADLVAQRGT